MQLANWSERTLQIAGSKSGRDKVQASARATTHQGRARTRPYAERFAQQALGHSRGAQRRKTARHRRSSLGGEIRRELGIALEAFKVVALRECPTPVEVQLCDTPQRAVDYWRAHITIHPYFNPECECFAVLHLNTRRRIRGHNLVATSTMDRLLVHPREVFRTAIASGASALVLMHNHPSGQPQPSEADIRVTRELIRAGQLMKMDVLDHIIVGNPHHASLRELGYFGQ